MKCLKEDLTQELHSRTYAVILDGLDSPMSPRTEALARSLRKECIKMNEEKGKIAAKILDDKFRALEGL